MRCYRDWPYGAMRGRYRNGQDVNQANHPG